MVAGMLNLGDAGATHVCNCMKVQSAHNPLCYHVVPKAVGNDIPCLQVLNPSRLHHPFEVIQQRSLGDGFNPIYAEDECIATLMPYQSSPRFKVFSTAT